MYSNIESVQILIALLKKYEIGDIVLSPGGSDIPLIHSIETDPFFTCYSVVDERSAAYFAMGVAQAKRKPAACICTSGTAACNYVPGITEAFYQNAQVVAITADKNPYYQGQLEIQKIQQDRLFEGVVKKSVSLPPIRTEEDRWLCVRLANEALLELDHHGTGPVHINIPIVGDTSVFDCKELPSIRKIDRFDGRRGAAEWERYTETLGKANKILVVVGQNVWFDENGIQSLNAFFDKYNCIFAVEHLSNLHCNGAVPTYGITETGSWNAMNAVLPDLVISLGNNLAAYQLKPFLRKNCKKIDNWLIHETGAVRDAYQCLTNIFECSPSLFFEMTVQYAPATAINDKSYYRLWQELLDQIRPPDFRFSNFSVAQQLSQMIPEDSVLHLAVLNSIRVMQFFGLQKNVRTFSNVGTLGIDGCFSTFAGQAAATDHPAFLLIGDLSFFYDMNAAGLRSIGKNVRIILLNNRGGSEFHFFMGKKAIPTINDYVCAQHANRAEGWIRSLGYEYYAASCGEDLDNALSRFAQPSDKPMFLEVFTDMEEDAAYTKAFYQANRKLLDTRYDKDSLPKKVVKAIVSDSQLGKAKKLVDRMKGK